MDKERLQSVLERRKVLMDDLRYEGEGMDDFYPVVDLRSNYLSVLVDVLEPHIRPGMRAIDLGSGSGNICLTLASLGVETHGIDARRSLVTDANRAASRLEEEGLIPPGSCRFYWGNYFPSDFHVAQKAKWYDWTEGETILQGTDPYRDMGLTLVDLDIIALYQYDRNRRSTLQLVGERCKQGALVVVLSGRRFYRRPQNLDRVLHVKTNPHPLLGVCIDLFRVAK